MVQRSSWILSLLQNKFQPRIPATSLYKYTCNQIECRVNVYVSCQYLTRNPIKVADIQGRKRKDPQGGHVGGQLQGWGEIHCGGGGVLSEKRKRKWKTVSGGFCGYLQHGDSRMERCKRRPVPRIPRTWQGFLKALPPPWSSASWISYLGLCFLLK